MENELNISIDEPIFSISTAAKLLGISIQTLRLYEKEGLIFHFVKNPTNDYTHKMILNE